MMTIEPSLLLSALLSVLLVAACDSGDASGSPEQHLNAQDQSEDAIETLTLELALPEDTAPAEVEAIAKSAEAVAGDEVSGAKIMAEKNDDGPMVLKIELWGAALDDEETVLASLRERHPILQQTPVALVRRDGAPEDADAWIGEGGLAKDATTEEIEAAVKARLSERGVEGEVHVEVHEENGQRRVEVRVEDDEKLKAQ